MHRNKLRIRRRLDSSQHEIRALLSTLCTTLLTLPNGAADLAELIEPLFRANEDDLPDMGTGVESRKALRHERLPTKGRGAACRSPSGGLIPPRR